MRQQIWFSQAIFFGLHNDLLGFAIFKNFFGLRDFYSFFLLGKSKCYKNWTNDKKESSFINQVSNS